MEKPITLVIDETKQNLANVLNESKLPMWVIDIIVQDLARYISGLAQQEKAQAIGTYEKSLQDSAEEPIV